MKQKYILGLSLVGVGAAAAYFGRQWYLAVRAEESAKHVISDETGNYDIDGVSFDRDNSEVVVSGDKTRGEDPRREALLH
ncbi:MAG: hypothetical protein EOP11_19195 [Proteobacteria bacterium]|nr:MAG: hypothetical protein EOP11_19195 [Pseudomonadota bacterium]